MTESVSRTKVRSEQPDSEGLLSSAVRKVWIRVVPFVFVLYIISFMDRGNISFAISSMETQIPAFTAAVLGLASGIFFIGYFVFQMPGTYLVEKWSAKGVISIFLFGWGIFAMLTGTSRNPGTLYAFRFMTGFMEGAFFPGVIYYLTTWFPSRQKGAAVALFMTAVPVSEVIAAPLSTHIIAATSWPYVFYIEGIPAIAFSIITLFYLTNKPKDAKWLSAEERNALIEVLEAEKVEAAKRGSQKIGKALANPLTIILALIYFFWVTTLYAGAIWAPDIIQLGGKLGIVGTGNLITVIWLVALVAMVVVGHHSDKTSERIYHAAIPFAVGAVGTLLAIGFPHNFYALFFGLLLITVGFMSSFGSFWSLPTKYLTAATAAVSIGFINAVGNLGGFVGPYMIGDIKSATGNFQLAYGLLTIFFVLALILTLLLKKFREVQ